jgi:hypothetical protein
VAVAYKRQAVAAEYNSGRDNMAAWYREVGISEQVGRELLNECRQVHLVGSVDAVNVSQALPTSKAARIPEESLKLRVGSPIFLLRVGCSYPPSTCRIAYSSYTCGDSDSVAQVSSQQR